MIIFYTHALIKYTRRYGLGIGAYQSYSRSIFSTLVPHGQVSIGDIVKPRIHRQILYRCCWGFIFI